MPSQDNLKDGSDSALGAAAAGSAFLIWGLSPIYWKSLAAVPAFEILMHRMIWSFVFLAPLVLAKGRFKDMGYAIQRTNPGEHYHWHIDGGSHDFADRQLVALWYLNDVEGPGGGDAEPGHGHFHPVELRAPAVRRRRP
mgnify:CR=1 FL=1